MREPYVTLGAGAVFGLQLFRDDDGILLHERAHGGQDMAQAASLFEFLYAHLGVLPQGVEQNGLPLFKRRVSIFDEIVVAGNLGLALDFQSRRYGRLEDVAHRAEVIVGNPFPETQLRPAQDRRTVEQGRELLDFVALRLDVVQGGYDGGVETFAPEGYDDTAADDETLLPRLGYAVGKVAVERQWQYDVGKSGHVSWVVSGTVSMRVSILENEKIATCKCT